MYNKYKKLINKKIISKEELTNLPENMMKAFEHELIIKALEKNLIKKDDVLNISNYAFEALLYPSIHRCLVKNMKRFNLFYKKLTIQNILNIKTEEELIYMLEDAQKTIKRSPLSLFTVPIHIHDNIFIMKKRLLEI